LALAEVEKIRGMVETEGRRDHRRRALVVRV
jgi:hypothetical protein